MATSGLVTILFTDLVGSTEHASDVGDAAADDLRRDHFAAPARGGRRHRRHRGEDHRRRADGLLHRAPPTRWPAPRRCSGRSSATTAGSSTARRSRCASGSASATPAFEDGDWFGTPVVEAARLCARGRRRADPRQRPGARARRHPHAISSSARSARSSSRGCPSRSPVCEVVWQIADPITADAPARVRRHRARRSRSPAARDELEIAAPRRGRRPSRARAASCSCRASPASARPGSSPSCARRARPRVDRALGPLRRGARRALRAVRRGAAPLRRRVDAARPAARRARPARRRARAPVPELAGRVPGPGRADGGRRPRPSATACSRPSPTCSSEISAAAPVVLVLDDLHWADKPSLAAAPPPAARRPRRCGCSCSRTYRDTDLDRSHPLADVLADLRREPGVDRLDLARPRRRTRSPAFMANAAGHELDERGAASSPRRCTPRPRATRSSSARCCATSSSPARIVQDATAAGRATSRSPTSGIPEGIREVVGRRLSRLSDAANRALALGAVIGPTFDLATIEGAGGPTGDELFDALDEATPVRR